MNTETRNRLRAINRRFYAARATAFSASRDHAWPGWTRVWARRAGASATSVLDVGCGNGRFAAFLAVHAEPYTYLGIDASEALLERARAQPGAAAHAFQYCDVLADPERSVDWPQARYDVVVAFGLLHHVPSRVARAALVARMADRVAPGGLLALTAWRFADGARFESHRVPWAAYNEGAAEPIDTSELEAGDCLLRFGAEPGPPRYCHAIDDAETAGWSEAARLTLVDDFRSDGRSGDLNRYVVFARDAPREEPFR